ncbi:MAG TPA: methylenetetrahydrofolate reductase [Steroidobacteraceae bacterium]|nr:methylenetetrahydrofolate reductase [Steroidobacteraceae bacterium]
MNAQMTSLAATGSLPDLKRTITEFARAASAEISTHDEGILPDLANVLPRGTMIYVAHTPKAQVTDVVRVAAKCVTLGFRACPHIVARRISSPQLLREALRTARDGGVEQVLLVAGDLTPPAGEFTSTLEILDSGAITDAGIKNVGVAGHPEGHPVVGAEVLWSALARKQAFAERTGVRVHIVTQFGFNPEAVASWDRELTNHGIKLPVHVGMAGPTPLPKLIKFAVQCGIGASFGSLMKNMSALGGLTGFAGTPEQMLTGLVRVRAGLESSHIVQPHLYAFGGVMATARWLRAVIDGRFELDAEGHKFSVES